MREFIYNTLVDNPAIRDFIGKPDISGHVFQGGSMTTATTPKPFLVYHIGNDTSEQLAEMAKPHRQFFQVYVHGVKGDYTPVDKLVGLVIEAFRGKGSPRDGIYMVRYLETSQDLKDEVLDTIFRYVRFQLPMS